MEWPFHRKDMEVYGRTGYIHADDASTLRVRTAGIDDAKHMVVDPRPAPYDDPFSYLAAVVRGDSEPGNDLSSLETNLIVMEILDVAMRSARPGMTIELD